MTLYKIHISSKAQNKNTKGYTMNLLEILEKEVADNKKFICLTPYDMDFPFVYLSLTEYTKCENLSTLWEYKQGKRPEEFEYSYVGEDSLINEISQYKFKTLIQNLDDDTDFEKLTEKILKLHYGYLDTVEVRFYEYNYAVYGTDGKYICHFNETALVEELLEEETGISINDLQAKYNCIDIDVNTECYFNQGNWHDMDYKDSKRVKIQFID